MQFILTSRFTTETLLANREGALKIGVQCIYCTPTPIDASIPADAVMYMIEMNNTTNSIAGIGMLRNRGECNRYTIYSNERYNVFTYKGQHRISRKEMTEDELMVVRVLEVLCFTGSYHLKRSLGLTRFSPESLRWCVRVAKIDISAEISAMFRRRMIEVTALSNEPVV